MENYWWTMYALFVRKKGKKLEKKIKLLAYAALWQAEQIWAQRWKLKSFQSSVILFFEHSTCVWQFSSIESQLK